MSSSAEATPTTHFCCATYGNIIIEEIPAYEEPRLQLASNHPGNLVIGASNVSEKNEDSVDVEDNIASVNGEDCASQHTHRASSCGVASEKRIHLT